MNEVTIYVTGPDQLKAVYALLGGASSAVPLAGNTKSNIPSNTSEASASSPAGNAENSSAPADQAASPSNAGGDPAELDSAGVAWDANKHASTKGKTKDGLWRMKVGVARPEGEGIPLAGGQSSGADTASASSPTATNAAGSGSDEEEDEFAAFRSAAGTASSAPVARNWTDADLSKICNQAAVATGNPENVKAIIAKYIPEGQPAHSRHIPADQRETFAREVESAFGIQYAG